MSNTVGTVIIDVKADTAKLVKGMTSAQHTMSKTVSNMQKTILSLGGAYAAFDYADKAIEAFKKMENAQISVSKTTGLSGDSLKELTDRIDLMSVSMAGLKVDGLYDIAEAAGQLGISGTDNITEFTRVIGMVGVTTDLTAKESATAFAKLSNSLNEPISKIETLASVANELSNTTTATVGDLLKFSQRLSGGAKTAGLATAEIFGLSATMTDLAINFETGGTNINRVMLDLVSDSKSFADAMGVDATAFAETVQNEPIKALQQLLVHMEGLSKTDAANFLTDLGYTGVEVKDVLLKLSSNTALLTKNLKISNDEYKKGTSIIDEYKVSSAGLEAQLTKSESAMQLMQAEVGKLSKSPLIGFMNASTYTVGILSKAFIDLSHGVDIVATGYTELFVAVDTGAAQLAQRFEWLSSALTFDTEGMEAASTEWERLDKLGRETIANLDGDLESSLVERTAQAEKIQSLMDAVYSSGSLESGTDANGDIGESGAPITKGASPIDTDESDTNEKEDEKAQAELDRYLETLARKAEMLQESLLAEDELLLLRYEQDLELNETAFQNKLITEAQHKDTMTKLEDKYQKKLTTLTKKGFTDRQKFAAKSGKDQVKTVLGDIQATTAGVANGNRTMFNINKAAGIANAGISMYEGISKTLGAFPYPIAIPLAALHAAAGAAQIANIASASYGGGGSTSAPSSTGGLSTTDGVVPSDIGNSDSNSEESIQEQKNITINLGDSAIMNTDSVRSLIEAINEELGDGASLVAS